MFKQLALAAATTIALGGVAYAEGDPEAGSKVFRKCKACHVADDEKNKVGPHLVGIMGRESGSVEGFKYSDAMANAGIVWDETTIAAYLADPKGYVDGNRMAFAGLKKEADIENVIAYLQSLAGS